MAAILGSRFMTRSSYHTPPERRTPLVRDPFDDRTTVLDAQEYPARQRRALMIARWRVSTLQNHRCFLKIQPRIAWVELVWVSIAQVAEKIDLPLAVREEFRIQFIRVETGHRSAI
jgi:hypothetical protein